MTYAFICGRGAQEKTIAERTGEFALDGIPTCHDGANIAWQQLSLLAHHLSRSVPLDPIAVPTPWSRQRTKRTVACSRPRSSVSDVLNEGSALCAGSKRILKRSLLTAHRGSINPFCPWLARG